MNKANPFKIRQERRRNVFRNSRSKQRKPLWRLIIEAISMITIAVGLLVFLNWPPISIDWNLITLKALSEIFLGLSILIRGIFSFLIFIFICLTLIISILLLYGGIWRTYKSTKLIYGYIIKSNRKRRINRR